MDEQLGIAGSGAIACGLAAVAALAGDDVVLWARSEASAERARASVLRITKGELNGELNISTDPADLAGATFVVEAVVEDHDAKAAVFREIAARAGDDTLLATTTSSLSIAQLARESGRPERFVGLHLFNPVHKMELVELVFPPEASDDTRRRAHELCAALEKTAVEVPDLPGFVVNRLLFPYLFGAVRLLEESGLEPQAIDDCMRLGAGHPLGPLALVDLIGVDVAIAIGETIGERIPGRLREMEREGALGRKAGRGFYEYES